MDTTTAINMGTDKMLLIPEYYITEALFGLEQSGLVMTNNYIGNVYKFLTQGYKDAKERESEQ